MCTQTNVKTNIYLNTDINAEKYKVSSMIEDLAFALGGWGGGLGGDHSRKSLGKANLFHLVFNLKAQIGSLSIYSI